MEKLNTIKSIIFVLAKNVGKVMLVLCAVILVCIVVLVIILLIQSPGKVKPLLDGKGNVIKGSIAEKVHTKINGVDMGMIIKSKNTSNPVLLFVHGGPGMPEYPLTENYTTGLEDNFTVVWWDQRGAGLSYNSGISKEKMTTEQFVSDTIEVSKYLCQRFKQDKIYLLGHSWGTFIAIQAAEKSPELYHAYIGVGQITNQIESEKRAYDYMLDYYKKVGNEKVVKKLQGLSFVTKDYLPKEYDKVRDSLMHKAGIGTTHKMQSVVTGVFLPVMKNSEYTLKEKINIWRGKIFSNSCVLREELYKGDLRKTVTKFKIPIYFFSGSYDYTVNYSMGEEYMKKIDAPIKGFYLFKESAHSPMFEEPEKVMQVMLEDVKNNKNNLADAH